MMSQATLKALKGLGETDVFAAEFDSGCCRANELPSSVCACCCCLVCAGVAVGAAPVFVETEIAAWNCGR